MAPILIVLSVLSAVVHLGTDVVGLDLSIAQDQAGKAKLSTLVAPPSIVAPTVPLAPATPALPSCPRLTAAMQDDALNLIEFNRVTGKCSEWRR